MKAFAVLFLILLLPLSCKKNSDIFATVNGGTITRLEFNDWLNSRDIPADSVYKDKHAFSDYLRQIAVEKLTAIKAEKSGYDKEIKYRILEDALHKNLLSTFFIEKKREKITFSEKAADLSLIRFFLKKSNTKERLIEEENKKLVIKNLLAELQAGKDFNDLAGKYSEDASSQKKGHIGFVPENGMEDGIKNAVSLLKENEYTKEPVLSGGSLCLIKLHKRYELTEKNINNIVTDKESAEKIVDFYKTKVLDEILDEILKRESLVSNIDKVSYKNSKEIIFVVDGESFTTGELELILKLFYSLKYGVPSADGFSLKEKKITSEKFFKERLFASEAKKFFIEDDAGFKRSWFYLKRATLAGAFKYDTLSNDLMITNDDIRIEYNQNKKNKYYRMETIKKEETKVFLTLDEVKSAIKNQLRQKKLKLVKKKWDDAILDESNYKIENKDLLVN